MCQLWQVPQRWQVPESADPTPSQPLGTDKWDTKTCRLFCAASQSLDSLGYKCWIWEVARNFILLSLFSASLALLSHLHSSLYWEPPVSSSCLSHSLQQTHTHHRSLYRWKCTLSLVFVVVVWVLQRLYASHSSNAIYSSVLFSSGTCQSFVSDPVCHDHKPLCHQCPPASCSLIFSYSTVPLSTPGLSSLTFSKSYLFSRSCWFDLPPAKCSSNPTFFSLWDFLLSQDSKSGNVNRNEVWQALTLKYFPNVIFYALSFPLLLSRCRESSGRL